MLTFEKVLEIFEDYLAQDMELEVYKSRYGYVCVSFNGSPPDKGTPGRKRGRRGTGPPSVPEVF